jgi:pimeloyl-ACP methyl ester carboxylesterase
MSWLRVQGRDARLADEAGAMLRALPSAQLVSVPEAGHDVHLDAPTAWRDAVEGFLASLS